MRAAALVACCLVALTASTLVAGQTFLAQATLRGSFNYPSVRGLWRFQQDSVDGPVTINITVSGVEPGVYASHVHTWGDVNSGLTAASPAIDTGATTTAGVGGHFNPFSKPHDCYPAVERHVGDFLANLTITSTGEHFFSFQRDLIQLGGAGAANVIGRSVVLHYSFDRCAAEQPSGMSGPPQAQGVIGLVDPVAYGYPAGTANQAGVTLASNPVSAVARMVAVPASGLTVAGMAQFGFDAASGRVRVVLNVTGMPPSSTHAFHVHTWGDDTDSSGDIAGGHFNPFNQPHGLPPNATRHFGDMGNVVVDAAGRCFFDGTFDLLALSGEAGAPTVIGHAVMLHALPDLGTQPTGGAGARQAIGVIGIANRPMPPASAAASASSSTASAAPFVIPSSTGAGNHTHLNGAFAASSASTLATLLALAAAMLAAKQL